MVRNLSRLIIASNERWVVPAGVNARRWWVLDVADTHANDRAAELLPDLTDQEANEIVDALNKYGDPEKDRTLRFNDKAGLMFVNREEAIAALLDVHLVYKTAPARALADKLLAGD
jgi:hypothetical protein